VEDGLTSSHRVHLACYEMSTGFGLGWKTIILSVVLYGGETLSITLMEEHGLKVSKNKVVTRERERMFPERRINRIMERITRQGTS
jgi:hypothetical protein